MKIDKYLLFDGAMGTYYGSKQRPYTGVQANIMDYNTIVSIHKEYIASGAQAITTNTFGNSDVESVRAACAAAQDAARGTNTLIFGSIGPLADSDKETYIAVLDQMRISGITNYLFETFPEQDTVISLAEYVKKQLPDSYVITSFGADLNGYTAQGKFYLDIVKDVKACPYIDAYGFNCVSGPVHMKELAAKLDRSDTISIMPNAGYPSFVDGKAEYTDNPEYFAEKLYEIHLLGVKILGGCCGTTPSHIRAASRLLSNSSVGVVGEKTVQTGIQTIVKENSFYDKLIRKEKSILVEYDPPLTATAEDIDRAAEILSHAGADALTVADNPLGRARADSLLVSARIQRTCRDMTVIPHLTCRDRNAISIRSALMGLNIEGICNILCITGDPLPSMTLPNAKGVFSFNSFTLLSYLDSINKELSFGTFRLGAAINVNAINFHLELERAKKKKDSGADFFITQPCFSERAVSNAIEAKNILNMPIIAGLMPIKSYRNAVFVQSEISGIDIPDTIVELFRDKTPEEAEEISVKLIKELATKLAPLNGYHIITPPKGEKIAARIIKEIR